VPSEGEAPAFSLTPASEVRTGEEGPDAKKAYLQGLEGKGGVRRRGRRKRRGTQHPSSEENPGLVTHC